MSIKASDEARLLEPPAVAAKLRLERKNKAFAFLLAGVGLAIFMVVIALVLALHYADFQLPGF